MYNALLEKDGQSMGQSIYFKQAVEIPAVFSSDECNATKCRWVDSSFYLLPNVGSTVFNHFNPFLLSW